ncbi:MAG: uracil-DNA glycosylase [Anaerolineales bacterium]|nr:uracil-DNA glycosylase [Anaerolineales bacterium]MCS7248529.1 uracil-DNA glycosylase [Anaerolineales bacterium]MDW8162342.1 uracil-DNA glycosylase [Anaerolineales bacterium]MDW8446003.1 uracil-DNA glycosylase [Anaerolineales bacterium]
MSQVDWCALEKEIVECRRCERLVSYRETVAKLKRRAYRDQIYWGKPVPGFGDRNAQVLIVGLAPGAHGSNRTGRMFTGDASGDFLYGALYRGGFSNQPDSIHRGDGLELKNVYVSAVCRCAPPGNKPTSSEIHSCLPYLYREIEMLSQLRVVVALGRTAFEAMTAYFGFSPKPPFEHGGSYPTPRDGLVLVASYHPSRQNTQTRRLTTEMFDQIWSNVKSILEREET